MEPDEIHLVDPDAVLDVTGNEEVDAWRGVKAEDVDEPDSGLAGLLRSRSRVLLGSLVRPHRWSLAIAAVMIALNTLAVLAGPMLVRYGIDDGIPPLLEGGDGS